jgi:hypothetical protein
VKDEYGDERETTYVVVNVFHKTFYTPTRKESKEYPDAAIWASKREAVREAKNIYDTLDQINVFGATIEVVMNYGYDDECVVWSK